MPPCQGQGSSHDSTGIGTGTRPSTTAPEFFSLLLLSLLHLSSPLGTGTTSPKTQGIWTEPHNQDVSERLCKWNKA